MFMKRDNSFLFGLGIICKALAVMAAMVLMAMSVVACGADKPEEYRIYVVDEQSAPVPGFMIQFCDDSICFMSPTDEKGLAAFAQPEGLYEVHVLTVPEGFKPDDTIYKTLDKYSDVTIVLKKE